MQSFAKKFTIIVLIAFAGQSCLMADLRPMPAPRYVPENTKHAFFAASVKSAFSGVMDALYKKVTVKNVLVGAGVCACGWFVMNKIAGWLRGKPAQKPRASSAEPAQFYEETLERRESHTRTLPLPSQNLPLPNPDTVVESVSQEQERKAVADTEQKQTVEQQSVAAEAESKASSEQAALEDNLDAMIKACDEDIAELRKTFLSLQDYCFDNQALQDLAAKTLRIEEHLAMHGLLEYSQQAIQAFRKEIAEHRALLVNKNVTKEDGLKSIYEIVCKVSRIGAIINANKELHQSNGMLKITNTQNKKLSDACYEFCKAYNEGLCTLRDRLIDSKKKQKMQITMDDKVFNETFKLLDQNIKKSVLDAIKKFNVVSASNSNDAQGKKTKFLAIAWYHGKILGTIETAFHCLLNVREQNKSQKA